MSSTITKYALFSLVLLVGITLPVKFLNVLPSAWSYVVDDRWPDADNIVMDDVFLPADTWSNPAQYQLSEWNEVDTTDNSHPFRINQNPQFSFGSDDGDNTMGFLGESGLSSEYGLSYASALAWASCIVNSSSIITECDVMLNPALSWQLVPDSDNFFQSTVLHEAGHIRGLDHYNNYLSMQNSGVDKILRGEVLYMDDKEGVRQNASHVSELDMAIYNKYHTGSVPAWMSVSPTTVRVGELVNFNNITVENRGTNVFNGGLRFGTYLSSNSIISTADRLLNTGSWGSYGRFTFSTFNWSATIPSLDDCGTYYIGGIIDDAAAHAERFEGNNAVVFVNGSPTPQPFTLLLERDGLESNDFITSPSPIVLPFLYEGLNLDQDGEQDYFQFNLPKNKLVTITATFAHGLGNIDLELLDTTGGLVQSSATLSNVETITRELSAGSYFVRVYGAGSGSCNRYVLAGTLSPLTIKVRAPNIDNVWSIGTTREIRWSSKGVTGDVKIQLSRNGGNSWKTLFQSTENDGKQSWTVTGPVTDQARIRVVSVNNSDVRDASNRNFIIKR